MIAFKQWMTSSSMFRTLICSLKLFSVHDKFFINFEGCGILCAQGVPGLRGRGQDCSAFAKLSGNCRRIACTRANSKLSSIEKESDVKY